MEYEATDSDECVDASRGMTRATGGSVAASVSRRRLLAVVGTAATAGLAGCAGLLGGGGGGGGAGDVRNEVDGIEVTDSSGEVVDGEYLITVTLENTGGETVGVLDFDYRARVYDDSDEEIPTGGNSVVNREEFRDDDTGIVELGPFIEGDPSTVESYEVVITCDDGPYCE
jgi:hypothetical protein